MDWIQQAQQLSIAQPGMGDIREQWSRLGEGHDPNGKLIPSRGVSPTVSTDEMFQLVRLVVYFISVLFFKLVIDEAGDNIVNVRFEAGLLAGFGSAVGGCGRGVSAWGFVGSDEQLSEGGEVAFGFRIGAGDIIAALFSLNQSKVRHPAAHVVAVGRGAVG